MSTKAPVSKREWVYLAAIVLAGFVLRTVDLSGNPAGFFRDEADKGYTTYSLLETGCDQTGRVFPLFVRSLNVTTSSLYQYLDMPFVSLFGLNEWTVRLPAALAGTASILAAYLVARAMWGGTYGLWAALFVCLSPWSLLLSRWANQSILLTVFIPLGVYFFVRNHGKGMPCKRDGLFSAFFFLLALYTYAPARLFVPVFVFLTLLISWLHRKSEWKDASWFAILFALGTLPLAYHVLFEPAESGARLSTITIFRGQPVLELIQEWIRNYFIHFSPYFLFVSGDQNLRHSTAVFGQLHWYILPLLVIGIIQAIRNRTRNDWLLLVWFLCFPIAAACTWESIPHALRSIFAIPAVHLLAAYGIKTFVENLKTVENHTSPFLLSYGLRIWYAVLIFFPLIYCYDLFVRYPTYSAMHWQYGYRGAIAWWQDHRQENDKTIVTGIAEYPEIFFLFYNRADPQSWIDTHTIDNIEFKSRGTAVTSIFNDENARTLYLIRPDELPNRQAEKVILLPQQEGDLPMPIWKWVVIEPKRNNASP